MEQHQIYKNDCQSLLEHSRRVVVKVGSHVLTAESGLHLETIYRLVEQVCWLQKQNREVIVVSSGAVAAGMRKMKKTDRPRQIRQKQALAALGQGSLMRQYEKAFEVFERKAAQILLTRDDLANRRRYLNARNTIQTLLEWGAVPIINENDTVVVDELKFGDNDNLAAMIAHLMDADLLVILTDIDGLYTEDPRTSEDACLVEFVDSIGEGHEKMACNLPGDLGTGGMQTKVEAAKKVTLAGIPMIVANGRKPDMIRDIFSGEPCGTFFFPAEKKMNRKKCWIAYAREPKGFLTIDQGAARALIKGGKSLLPIGITKVEGEFSMGETVLCQDENGNEIAVGLSNYPSGEVRQMVGKTTKQISKEMGPHPHGEVIHRDNLVLSDK